MCTVQLLINIDKKKNINIYIYSRKYMNFQSISHGIHGYTRNLTRVTFLGRPMCFSDRDL